MVLERIQKDKLPALRDMPKKKLLEEIKLIKFCIVYSTALQRLKNAFMQELLLLQIVWEKRLIRQQRERNKCGGGGYKVRLKS